nr:hypothetical protein [Burkholderia cepacia]
MTERAMGVTRACGLVGISRSLFHYESRRRVDDEALTDRMMAIIIDQPEENLDNQTIFKVLVKCIKAAKQRRQVIMVTHNPNLAVVCDAEQIICATRDKTTNTFNYVSGGIESPLIKNTVVEILEGTEPAFKNRKRKYGL